ncbi:MAG: response regulator transcription factor [Solobacterium sp.]|nr:response regulator transcription factor [Solobacterium sp.]
MNGNMHICAIDDDSSFLDVLMLSINKIKSENMIPVFLDTFSSYRDINPNKQYDLFFIDIEMPDKNGFEIARQIHQLCDSSIVFVTSIEEYVFQSFEYNPYGFIRKSRLMEDTRELILRYRNENQQKIRIYYDYHFVQIPKNQIERITVQGNSVMVHTVHRQYESRISLKKFIMEHPNLDALNLIQISQSCIVNIEKIVKFDPPEIQMESGARVELSRKYLQNFKNKYFTFKG